MGMDMSSVALIGAAAAALGAGLAVVSVPVVAQVDSMFDSARPQPKPETAQPVASAVLNSNPAGDFVRGFIGNGIAENPNAGIFFGNGFSYTEYAGACISGVCDGGRAGPIGNGGMGGMAAGAAR